MPREPVNPQLIPGIGRLSRSAVAKKRGLWKKNKPAVAKKADTKPTTVSKAVKGAKNGETRQVPVQRASRYYPTEDTPKPLVNRKKSSTATLRKTITPGTVLILLSGRFRGKRVVFLKQLASGLLLVTGPFKINGVPLRRVNQAYVVATSTKIDISGEIDAKFNDDYFKRPVEQKKKKAKADPAAPAAPKEPKIKESRVADQKEVDKLVIEAVKKVPYAKAYLNASFSLSKGQFPHLLKF